MHQKVYPGKQCYRSPSRTQQWTESGDINVRFCICLPSCIRHVEYDSHLKVINNCHTANFKQCCYLYSDYAFCAGQLCHGCDQINLQHVLFLCLFFKRMLITTLKMVGKLVGVQHGQDGNDSFQEGCSLRSVSQHISDALMNQFHQGECLASPYLSS